MRKTVIALVALGLVVASSAGAASFWAESFNYPDGGLVAVSGGNWIGHSTSTATNYIDVQVVSGEAVLTGANAQDDSRLFPAQSATATTYAAFVVKVVGTGTSGTVYFAHFKNTGTSFCAQTYAILTGATTFNLGISSTSTLSATWPTPLTKGVYYNVVTRYNATTGISTLWVDPVDQNSTSISSVVGYTGTLVTAFALRQATFADKIHVDKIGVGDSFIDAFLAGPTPVAGTTWGKLKNLYR